MLKERGVLERGLIVDKRGRFGEPQKRKRGKGELQLAMKRILMKPIAGLQPIK